MTAATRQRLRARLEPHLPRVLNVLHRRRPEVQVWLEVIDVVLDEAADRVVERIAGARQEENLTALRRELEPPAPPPGAVLAAQPDYRMPSAQWEVVTGVSVLDPDGWDRRDFADDWTRPITAAEFRAKAQRSTCRDARGWLRGGAL